MANLLPVEIDTEDIHRQAMFLSQARYVLLLVCLFVEFYNNAVLFVNICSYSHDINSVVF